MCLLSSSLTKVVGFVGVIVWVYKCCKSVIAHGDIVGSSFR